MELYINDDKSIFQQLLQRKDDIEANIGSTLDWRALPDKKASRIIIEKPVNLDERDEWNSQFDWIMDTALKFKKAFKRYI